MGLKLITSIGPRACSRGIRYRATIYGRLLLGAGVFAGVKEVSRVEEQPKTVHDSTFAQHERELLTLLATEVTFTT